MTEITFDITDGMSMTKETYEDDDKVFMKFIAKCDLLNGLTDKLRYKVASNWEDYDEKVVAIIMESLDVATSELKGATIFIE